MTDATLNVNNNVDICFIPPKFPMLMYDRMTNIYTYPRQASEINAYKNKNTLDTIVATGLYSATNFPDIDIS